MIYLHECLILYGKLVGNYTIQMDDMGNIYLMISTAVTF